MFAGVSTQDTGGPVRLGQDGTCNITVPEGHYVEINITFLYNFGLWTCYRGIYFEIRDGLNQSSSLLAAFCESFKDRENAFRSSGRYMLVKLHKSQFASDYNLTYYTIYARYPTKKMNATCMYYVTLFHFVYSTNPYIYKKK